MQQSNGTLDFSDRIYQYSIWQIGRITKGYGSFYNDSDIFPSLANEMQQSNGKLDFSDRI